MLWYRQPSANNMFWGCRRPKYLLSFSTGCPLQVRSGNGSKHIVHHTSYNVHMLAALRAFHCHPAAFEKQEFYLAFQSATSDVSVKLLPVIAGHEAICELPDETD